MTTTIQGRFSATSLPSDNEISQMGREECVALLQSVTAIHVEIVLAGARIVARLKELGEDVSKLQIAGCLLRVANGTLLPEIVIRFAGRQKILSKVSSLSIPDQREMLSTQGIRVGVLDERGEATFVMRQAEDLDAEMIEQVCGDGVLRSPESQIEWRKRRSMNVKMVPKARVYVDADTCCLIVTAPSSLTEADLVHNLEKLRQVRKHRRMVNNLAKDE